MPADLLWCLLCLQPVRVIDKFDITQLEAFAVAVGLKYLLKRCVAFHLQQHSQSNPQDKSFSDLTSRSVLYLHDVRAHLEFDLTTSLQFKRCMSVLVHTVLAGVYILWPSAGQHSIASCAWLSAPQGVMSIHLKYWWDNEQTWSFTVRLRVSSPLDAMCCQTWSNRLHLVVSWQSSAQQGAGCTAQQGLQDQVPMIRADL